MCCSSIPTGRSPGLPQALGRSLAWVKKWRRRIRQAQACGEPLAEVLQGGSCAHKHPSKAIDPLVVERILAIRDEPPEGLHRTPGPEAILYYLPRDQQLQEAAVPLPRSSRTIYRILKKHGRIPERRPRQHDPQERNPPMAVWQADFKDINTVPPEPGGKRQHGVETLDNPDLGTSALLDAQVRPDFTAEVAIDDFVEPRLCYGCPASVVVDRDVRWVGSPAGSDFPSAALPAFVRAWAPRPTFAPHITPKKMDLWRGSIEPTSRNASPCSGPAP